MKPFPEGEHRGLDHRGVMRDCIQEIHFCWGAEDDFAWERSRIAAGTVAGGARVADSTPCEPSGAPDPASAPALREQSPITGKLRKVRSRKRVLPYYQDDAVTIYHGDALVLAPRIPADMGVSRNERAEEAEGEARAKALSRAWATEHTGLDVGKDDNLADACCIAMYGELKEEEENA